MLLLLVFIFGLFIGSFLLVLIDRLPKKEGVIFGRSHCLYCNHTLFWYDLIPLLSFALLHGRCRYCKRHIGWQYPFVELITAVFFELTCLLISGNLHQIFIHFTLSIFLLLSFYLFLTSCFIVIFFMDIWYGIIPDVILLPAAIVTLSFSFFIFHFSFFPYIFSALGASGLFLFIYLVTRGKGMGLGDVKLVFFMGLLLGFPKIVISLYIAFLTGAIVSLILIAAQKKKFKGGTIAFGPFLVGATYISLFMGDMMWQIVLKHFFLL